MPPADERAGKISLTRHGVGMKPALAAEEILALRERLTLSRAVFARAQRANIPTPENGEQGRGQYPGTPLPPYSGELPGYGGAADGDFVGA